MSDLRYGVSYKVQYPAKGVGQSAPKRSRLHGKTVIIKKNNPRNSDIPSFEHGFVHLYDAVTGEYYGVSGIRYFATTVGLQA